MNGEPQVVHWEHMPIQAIVAVDVPIRFNFQPHPKSIT